jgi:hypothetical protein
LLRSRAREPRALPSLNWNIGQQLGRDLDLLLSLVNVLDELL